jgi:hypothetical protein
MEAIVHGRTHELHIHIHMKMNVSNANASASRLSISKCGWQMQGASLDLDVFAPREYMHVGDGWGVVEG